MSTMLPVGAACLEEQYRRVRVLGEPGRDDGARRPGPHHDVVVFRRSHACGYQYRTGLDDCNSAAIFEETRVGLGIHVLDVEHHEKVDDAELAIERGPTADLGAHVEIHLK